MKKVFLHEEFFTRPIQDIEMINLYSYDEVKDKYKEDVENEFEFCGIEDPYNHEWGFGFRIVGDSAELLSDDMYIIATDESIAKVEKLKENVSKISQLQKENTLLKKELRKMV